MSNSVKNKTNKGEGSGGVNLPNIFEALGGVDPVMSGFSLVNGSDEGRGDVEPLLATVVGTELMASTTF